MAAIRGIELDDEENPEFVTARLTVEEAAFIAKLCGKNNDVTANEVMPGGATANHNLYEAFVGAMFNRFYDGGVDEYLQERR